LAHLHGFKGLAVRHFPAEAGAWIPWIDMAAAAELLIGEFVRTLDERFRLSLPAELLDPLQAAGSRLVIAKERAGCLSLWSAATWKPRLDAAVEVIRSKLQAGLLSQRVGQLQDLGRLLSTRHATASLAGRGRLVLPDGFREFLGVEPGGDVMVVGAAVCVELWQPAAWSGFVSAEMPGFRQRIDDLTA
jgi:MraZ protein